MLDLKLFPASVKQTELTYYKTKLNRYGLPLDNRRDYTQVDWELWTATLADNDDTFQKLVAPLGKWLDATPGRVTLTDWYDTITGEQQGFQARSVGGGIFKRSLRRSPSLVSQCHFSLNHSSRSALKHVLLLKSCSSGGSSAIFASAYRL